MPRTDPPPHHAADDEIAVVAYDPAWPAVYAAERVRLLAAVGGALEALEHIGSTAVPQLAAKPIIDMMGAVVRLEAAPVAALNALGYEVIVTGMRNRLFLRNYQAPPPRRFHLHLVAQSTWDTRKERLMRDYLVQHPEAAAAYAALKARLALEFPNDMPGYTRAKTAFLQDLITRARQARGLPAIDVWNDE